MIYVGTAGWAIPQEVRASFPDAGSGLERYARVLSCVEINSTFYRSHRAATYARWAASVPDAFRFSLKIPKSITHLRRLDGCEELVKAFVEETAPLEQKRGVLLVQLPPSLAFDDVAAGRFFEAMRERFPGLVACEARHATWFSADADAFLRSFSVARVAADPPPVPATSEPGGLAAFAYYRWHGSPRIYYSAYEGERIEALAATLAGISDTWCIFDNTALGAAASNALLLASRVGQAQLPVPQPYTAQS